MSRTTRLRRWQRRPGRTDEAQEAEGLQALQVMEHPDTEYAAALIGRHVSRRRMVVHAFALALLIRLTEVQGGA